MEPPDEITVGSRNRHRGRRGRQPRGSPTRLEQALGRPLRSSVGIITGMRPPRFVELLARLCALPFRRPSWPSAARHARKDRFPGATVTV